MLRVTALVLVLLVSTASTGRAWCEAACAAPQASAGEQASDPHAHCTSGAALTGKAAASSPDAPAMTPDAACDMRTTVWPPAFQAKATTLVAAATSAAVLVRAPLLAPARARTAPTTGAPSPPSVRRSIPLRI
ncbi:MAG: hypothetical protein AB7H88_12940 [Vicinamibacterales bacterium]